MKSRHLIPTLLFGICLLFAVSCGEDILSIARWVEEYHQEKWGISTSQAILYCHLDKTKTPKVYEGTLTIMENGVEWEFPLEVRGKGKDKEIVYILSPEQDINQLQIEYSRRVELSYKLDACQSWWDVGKVLTGDYLSEYMRIENRREELRHNSNRSVADMERYNDFLMNEMKPFLIRISAPTRFAFDLVMTNEQREKEIQSDKDWLMGEMKKARNKWVDNNPIEARRRGITKF